MDPEEDCKIINLRDARSSCYWFYEGNKKAAKGDGDNIEGDPHEEGDIEAEVVLTLACAGGMFMHTLKVNVKYMG